MTFAKSILPGLLLAIGTAAALADEAGQAAGPPDAAVTLLAAAAADGKPAPHATAAAAPADSLPRPKSKRQRHRKAAAPAAAKAPEAAVASPEAPAAEAGHAPAAQPAPAVSAAVPVPRVQVRDRAAAAVAVAAAQAAVSHPAPAHGAPVPAAQDEHVAPVTPAAAPAAVVVARGEECNPPFRTEVAALFDRWNAALRTGDPKKVVANYAPDSVLLPTLSNRARFTAAEKEEYFQHFLQRGPEGRIDDRVIDTDCNSAVDSGLYTFRFMDGSSVRARYTFAYKRVNGEWLISSHHSSAMPEKANGTASGAEAAQPGAGDEASPARGWVRFP